MSSLTQREAKCENEHQAPSAHSQTMLASKGSDAPGDLRSCCLVGSICRLGQQGGGMRPSQEMQKRKRNQDGTFLHISTVPLLLA